MNWKRQLAVLLFWIASAGSLHAGDVIDRIVATVGKHAVLQSDLDEAVRFEMFTAGRDLASVTNEDVKSALDHLIDQQLIRDDTGEIEALAPAPEDYKKRISELRAQLPGATTDDGWRLTLKKYGLTEKVVSGRIESQLETMRMVNQKLRPNVRVDQAEIATAYRDEFLPKLRQAGANDVPLPEVSGRIRQILIERHIGEMLETWLQGLRAQADIRIDLNELKPADANPSAAKVVDSPETHFENLQ